MRYRCPQCNQYGMQWDARAKVLMCYYNACKYIIRIGIRQEIPTPREISTAIKKDAEQVQHKTIENIIPAV